ncbi:unnamed protein product, partial [Closterium sp. Naga37s-1]
MVASEGANASPSAVPLGSQEQQALFVQKRQALLDLVDYAGRGQVKFNEALLKAFAPMLKINLEVDPWPRLELIYLCLLQYVATRYYIDQQFILKLLNLFDAEDPRERDYLKTILHQTYKRFTFHRPFIREAIGNTIYQFIESERHNGIAELLEVLGGMINKFVPPLKEKHKQFLDRVLVPLHKPECVAMYHHQLSYCITQFVEKDPKLADLVLRGLLKFWPLINSQNELLFLEELEKILELTQAPEFEMVITPLFQQIARCLSSSDFEVVERTLRLWDNDYIVALVVQNRATILPLIFAALERNARRCEEEILAVNGLTINVRKMFLEMDQPLYDECQRQLLEEEGRAADVEEVRAVTWQRLEEAADSNTHSQGTTRGRLSFGMVMLVVVTGRKAVLVIEGKRVNIKQWVTPLVDSGAVAEFKDPHLEAPDGNAAAAAAIAARGGADAGKAECSHPSPGGTNPTAPARRNPNEEIAQATLPPFAEPLPLLKDVGAQEQQALFIRKLRLCSYLFDFNDPMKNVKEKEIKRQTLLELVGYTESSKALKEIRRMLEINLFRPLTRSAHGEMPRPTMEAAWPHLELVYEFLLRYVVSEDTYQSHCIDQNFILKLLNLFDSEDPRERECVETSLNRIYDMFNVHRPFIREAIGSIVHQWKSERRNSITEIFRFAIVKGFELPLGEKDKEFLGRALFLLHKPRCLPMYHHQLPWYCIIQFVEKDPELAEPVLRGLLKFWPLTDSQKEVLFLEELEEVLKETQLPEFEMVMTPLFQQIARCLSSSDFQVVERTLRLWNHHYIKALVARNHTTIMPLIFAAIMRNINRKWKHQDSKAVNSLATKVHDTFLERRADEVLYNDCMRLFLEEGANEGGGGAVASGEGRAQAGDDRAAAAHAERAGGHSAPRRLPAAAAGGGRALRLRAQTGRQ